MTIRNNDFLFSLSSYAILIFIGINYKRNDVANLYTPITLIICLNLTILIIKIVISILIYKRFTISNNY